MKRLALLLMLGMGLLSFCAEAQPVPNVVSVTPLVVQPGTTTDITFTGDNISDARRAILADGQGIKIEVAPTTQPSKARQIKAKVTVDESTPKGAFQLRLVTGNGVSKPVAMAVDDLPQLTEKEPNDGFDKAQAIALPGVIVGAISRPTEADYYRFTAKKGQRLIFDVQSQRVGSKLDPTLLLCDSSGAVITRDEDTNGLDSLIDCTMPTDGDYVLKIQDMRYQGGPGYEYRIRSGEIPYVDCVFPLGGRRGGNLLVELMGRNLATPRLSLAFDDKTALGRKDVSASSPRGTSNVRSFELGDVPEIIEAEPNDSIDYASPVTLPLTINGRIGFEGDVDTYRLRVATTQPVAVEVAAQRFGSPLDALLTLRDSDGKILQHNDDAMGADARIEIRDGKDKEYLISVSDLVGRGGESYAYRLKLTEQRPPAPNFVVAFPPVTPRVSRWGKAKVWCEVRRTGGFDGDVTVSMEGLPAGVTCEAVIFKAKEPNSGLLVLSASSDARPGMYPVRVVGKAKIADREIVRAARADEPIGAQGSILLSVLDTPPFIVDRVGPGAGDEDARSVREQTAALAKVIETQTPELDAGLARWESQQQKDIWQPLEFVSAGGKEREDIKLLPDGSLRVSGANPNTTFYTVALNSSARSIRAFKLEALVDGTGLGRADDGNFVISHFSVTAAPASNTGAAVPVVLQNPRADFAQAQFDVALTLREGTGRGWAVSPRTSEPHWAYWEVKEPVSYEEGTVYTFTIKHDFPGKFGLARFRIMATAAEKLEGNFSLPADVLAALAIEKDKRSEEQKKSLAAYYRTIAPELREVRVRLAELRTLGADFPPKTPVDRATSVAVKISRLNGFAGGLTLTAEGYSAGLDARTREPNPIQQNFQTNPVILKPDESFAKINLRALANAQKGTRMIVIKAEANIAGTLWTQYSEPIPLTVGDPPPPPPPAEKK